MLARTGAHTSPRTEYSAVAIAGVNRGSGTSGRVAANEERRRGFLDVAKIMMQLAMRRENKAFVRVKDACVLQ